jgi:transposase
MSKIGLSLSERRQLRRQLHRTSDARLCRRLLAILEVDQGKPVSELARLLKVSCQSIYNWIDRFRQEREVAALADRYGIGRPTLWTDERVALLRNFMESSPYPWGYFAVDWTVPLLREQLGHYTGQWLSEDTIRRELHRLGYVWKRGRYRLAPDPELEKKTADSQKSPRFAASERTACGRRNRLAAVPTIAGRLVAAGTTPRSAD